MSDEDVRRLIEEQREFHKQELRKYIEQPVAFVMGGGRLPREAVH